MSKQTMQQKKARQPNYHAFRQPEPDAVPYESEPLADHHSFTPPHLAHNFDRISVLPPPIATFQSKLTVNTPGDQFEQEADEVVEQVMRMTDPAAAVSVGRTSGAGIQRCGACSGSTPTPPASPNEEEHSEEMCPACAAAAQEAAHLQAKETPGATPTVTPGVQAMIDGMRGGGQPLDEGTRAFMEPRFGHSFANVRVHTDGGAVQASRAVHARAFTVGRDIAFGAGQYQPSNDAGRRLLAHELTHVVQQGAAPSIQPRSATGIGQTYIQRQIRYPGDGMSPPGDCAWRRYLALRGAVESAKAVVSMLGSCSMGNSCVLLAIKIAATTAEIAARVALDTTCFRGGNSGHRQQVQDKINMVSRCYKFFMDSNCPRQLIQAMEAVVESVREVIAAAAMTAAAIAAVVALVAALIVLVKVIIALGAGAAVVGAAAAVLALLVVVKDHMSPEERPQPA